MLKHGEKKDNQDKGKHKIWLILVPMIIIIIVLLALRSCGSTVPNGTDEYNSTVPIGNYDVAQDKQEKESEKIIEASKETITFSGYGEYMVSKDNPKIELANPEVNTVTMIFSIIDKETKEIIAKTNKINPGEFVYVNVVDYYKKPGNYEVTISTETYSSDGQQMNGMNQEMAINFVE